MVDGMDRFRTYFAEYADQYILIGGAACVIAMEELGQPFRATKDLDIVLCVESLQVRFVQAFWQFIKEGQYQTRKKSTGGRCFYRFQRPKVPSYPVMLELFSRTPEALTLAEGSVLTPIPMEGEVSSLSAILLDDDYYNFLQAGKRIVEVPSGQEIQIAGAEILIPLKARAWIDLTARKQEGALIDAKVIRKHKNDIFRLLAIADPQPRNNVPDVVKRDMVRFLEQMSQESLALKELGLGSLTFDGANAALQKMYRLSQ